MVYSELLAGSVICRRTGGAARARDAQGNGVAGVSVTDSLTIVGTDAKATTVCHLPPGGIWNLSTLSPYDCCSFYQSVWVRPAFTNILTDSWRYDFTSGRLTNMARHRLLLSQN